MMIGVTDWVENIVGKGLKKKTVTSIYPFPTMFSKGFFPRVKSQLISRCSNVRPVHNQSRLNLPFTRQSQISIALIEKA